MRERGQCAVYYTSPQSFIITFSYFFGSTTIRNCIAFLLVQTFQTFQPLIEMYRRGYFVYHLRLFKANKTGINSMISILILVENCHCC